jgi:hypothetical protein
VEGLAVANEGDAASIAELGEDFGHDAAVGAAQDRSGRMAAAAAAGMPVGVVTVLVMSGVPVMRRGCPAMASQRLASVATAAPKRKDRDRVRAVASKVLMTSRAAPTVDDLLQ